MAKCRFSRILAGALFLALVSAVFVAPIRIARAATVDLTCEVSFSLNFDPGLTLTPQNQTVVGTANISNCTQPNGMSGPHGSGVVNVQGSAANASCTSFDIIGKNGSINWSDKTKTSFDWEVKVAPLAVGSPLTVSANNLKDDYAGDTINAVPLVATLQGDCGVTAPTTQITSNVAVLTFTH